MVERVLTFAVPIAQFACMSSDFRETGRVPGHVRLDHVVIAVSDWDRSIRFYRDVMGAQVAGHPDGRVAFRFGAQQLNVHGPGVDAGTLVASPPVAPGGSDLCFDSIAGGSSSPLPGDRSGLPPGFAPADEMARISGRPAQDSQQRCTAIAPDYG